MFALRYAQYYAIVLQQMQAHKTATSFVARAKAREQLDFAQQKLARMHKSKDFCIYTVLAIVQQLKAQYA